MVRPEYVKLADGLPALAREFGEELGAAAAGDVRVFMAALECIDRVLDAVDDAGARARLSRAIVARLDGGDGASAHHELDGKLRALTAMAARRGIARELARLGERALDNTERMRTARDARQFVDCVRREGRLTVEMALLVAALDGECARFLRGVAELCNLYDKLKDARGDFRRGEMALRPGARLHARLLAATLARVPAAARLHPRLDRFVRWGLGYL